MNEPKVRTHYDNLQVKENASDEVIRGAYRYLCQKWHPDRNPENRPESERILKVLNQAYLVLSNPQRRAEYDKWVFLQHEQPSQPPPPPPPPSPSGPAASPSGPVSGLLDLPGMRWVTFWIYFSLPFEALLSAVFAFVLFGLSTPLGAIVGTVMGSMAVLQAWLCMQLRQGDHRAWVLNWIPISLRWIGGTIGVLATNGFELEERFIRAGTYFVLGAVLWMWPNWVYWHKRESLFTNADPNTLRRQWIWAPVAFWAIQLVILPVIAMLVLSAQSEFNAEAQHAQPSSRPAIVSQTNPTRRSDVAPAKALTIATPARSQEVPSSVARDSAWNEEIRLFMNDRDNDPILTRTESVALFNEQLNLVSQQYPNWPPTAIFHETTIRTVALLEQNGELTWEGDVQEFLASHCDVSNGRNKVLFQGALNESLKLGMANSQLLASAYNRVQAHKDFMHGANCGAEKRSSPQGTTPDAPKKPKCEYKAVMSDVEIARCRQG